MFITGIDKSLGGVLRFRSVVLGAAMSVPMFFGIAISVAAAPASTPLAAPVGSLVEREQEGLRYVKELREEYDARQNTVPLDAFNLLTASEQQEQRKEFLYDSKTKYFKEKNRLYVEVENERWRFEKENEIREGENPFEWVERMTHKFGVYPHPNTEIILAEETPCTVTRPNSDACVAQDLDIFQRSNGTNIKMYLSEDAVGDVRILIHEIAHTNGIFDECAADQYSRSITGIPGGGYC